MNTENEEDFRQETDLVVFRCANCKTFHLRENQCPACKAGWGFQESYSPDKSFQTYENGAKALETEAHHLRMKALEHEKRAIEFRLKQAVK